MESNWLVAFIDQVERRLDNVLFRLGFYPSIRAARQAVVHGHIQVNGKKIDIPSYIHNIAAAAALRTLCFPNIFNVKLIDSESDISLKKDCFPFDLKSDKT